MIPTMPWIVARNAPSRSRTPADEYARREFGGPSAAWLRSMSDGHAPRTVFDREVPANDGLFRRLAQVVAAFF
jgi:hypothetical protein